MKTEKLAAKKAWARPLVRALAIAEPSVHLLACTGLTTFVCPDAAEPNCCSFSQGTCGDDCPPF